ncbi:hypothetical protein ACRAKI_18955 [Saccharothrix isguenensis]
MPGIYLKRNGLSPDGIKKVEPIAVPPVSIEQSVRQRQIEVDVLGSSTAGTYVVTEQFLKDNPGTVRTFVTGVVQAIEWSRTTPREQVAEREVEILTKRGRNEDPAALRYWRSTGVAKRGGTIVDDELTLWIDWLRRSCSSPTPSTRRWRPSGWPASWTT